MKKLLILLCAIVIALSIVCYVSFKKYAHPKGFKDTAAAPVQEAAPVAKKASMPKAIDVGNPALTVMILGDDPANEEIPHDIMVTNKITNQSITISQTDPYHMIIQTAGNESNYIVVDTGTSTIRHLEAYNMADGSKKLSTCSLGYFMKGLTVVYGDCTEDKKFDIRAAVVENGQYNPVVYSLALDTGIKKKLIASDALHLYNADIDPGCTIATRAGDKCDLSVQSVKRFKDWADTKKWITGVKTLSI